MGRYKLVSVFGACIIILYVLTKKFDIKMLHYDRKEGNSNSFYKESETTEQLISIRRDCGTLCDTSRPGTPGPYFNHVSSPVDCKALFRNEFIDNPHGLKHAPRFIPSQIMDDFTMNGRLHVFEWYFNQPYFGMEARTPIWTHELVEKYVLSAKMGNLQGNYGVSETNALRDGLKHAPGVIGGRVLVIGSEDPWVEACVLEAGAKEIVTLEYGKIISNHKQIIPMTPSQFRKSFLNNTLGQFDAVVTFSSVEHSGLGRYGDALNPWGDIIAIARSWCVTKEHGSLTIGVMYDYENDCIKFNAGRWYGKIRYPYLTTNWKQLYRGHGSQRVHVFTKEKLETVNNLTRYIKEPFPYRGHENTDQKYSQANQDKTVHDLFQKQNGFFIEMGAFNGVTYSNTLWLERHHNWTGLLIEANPDLCAAIDSVQRRAWRLCACISLELSTIFIKGGALGSAEDTVDANHLKQLNSNSKVSVPCFRLDKILNTINRSHIDYFSLDVEGGEMSVLNSIKDELKSGTIDVDVWTIEYRVIDEKQKNIVEKSLKNLERLRTFFREVGGYEEHSQISDSLNVSDGMALDVIFINTNTWCKNHQSLPSGVKC